MTPVEAAALDPFSPDVEPILITVLEPLAYCMRMPDPEFDYGLAWSIYVRETFTQGGNH
jgi:hypothetical protein